MYATSTADMRAVNEAKALDELGRFFRLAREHSVPGSGTTMPMFSEYVDAAWHRLLREPDGYGAFCQRWTGVPMGHRESAGGVPVDWVPVYEAVHGLLPDVWFADASGRVDEGALAEYRRTGVVTADWDCAPVPGDGDDMTGEPRFPRPRGPRAS